MSNDVNQTGDGAFDDGSSSFNTDAFNRSGFDQGVAFPTFNGRQGFSNDLIPQANTAAGFGQSGMAAQQAFGPQQRLEDQQGAQPQNFDEQMNGNNSFSSRQSIGNERAFNEAERNLQNMNRGARVTPQSQTGAGNQFQTRVPFSTNGFRQSGAGGQAFGSRGNVNANNQPGSGNQFRRQSSSSSNNFEVDENPGLGPIYDPPSFRPGNEFQPRVPYGGAGSFNQGSPIPPRPNAPTDLEMRGNNNFQGRSATGGFERL